MQAYKQSLNVTVVIDNVHRPFFKVFPSAHFVQVPSERKLKQANGTGMQSPSLKNWRLVQVKAGRQVPDGLMR
jgi:hypothetical protein